MGASNKEALLTVSKGLHCHGVPAEGSAHSAGAATKIFLMDMRETVRDEVSRCCIEWVIDWSGMSRKGKVRKVPI
jgi:hypothetical protein